MYDDVSHAVAELLTDEPPDGDASVFAQPAVVVGSTLGRRATVDVDAQGAVLASALIGFVERLFELAPGLAVVGEVHVDVYAVEPETNAEGVGFGEVDIARLSSCG